MAKNVTSPRSPRSPTEFDKKLGAKIRRYRKGKQISQEEMGAAIGVSFQQYTKNEAGTNRLCVERLLQICTILEVPVAVMVHGLK